LIETSTPTLSKGMKFLNGTYTQYFSRQHRRVGHVLQWNLARFTKTKNVAQQHYRDFILAGKGQPSPWQQLKNQIYLGDDDFVNDMQRKLAPGQSLNDIPKKQKQAPVKSLCYFADRYKTATNAWLKRIGAGTKPSLKWVTILA
jgi:hypothetical protein